MGTITWKGEGGSGGEHEEIGYMGLKLKKGEAVNCDDEKILAKAYNNNTLEVSGWEPKDEEEEDKTHKAPSQVGSQYPVPKPGEPKSK